MARVFVAAVEGAGPRAAEAALARGLDALGSTATAPWTLVIPPADGLSRDERALSGQLATALGGDGARPQELRAVSRGAAVARYQLSVQRRGDQLEAHAGLYDAGPLAWLARLKLDVTVGGPGGALTAGADHLLFRPLDELSPDARHRTLAGLLEVADPEVVVGDGRFVALGAAAGAPRSHHLGLMLVADNAVAHDLVWAWMLGLEACDVPWLHALALRGFGPGALDDVELLGDDPEPFRRRLEGVLRPAGLAEIPTRYQTTLGVALPVDVLPCAPGPPASRALAWLAAQTEHPERRESLKFCPPFSLLAGARTPGAFPTHDRVLAVGPEATAAVLSDVRVDRARQRAGSFAAAFLRRSSAQFWDLRLSDGRTVLLAALAEEAPSPARIGRAAAALTRHSSLAWPRESRYRAVQAWVLRRLRRVRLPSPVVHARRIHRLQERPWRKLWLQGPPLRDDSA
ncbi:MAG: hypothetical protein KDA24_29040 [Deltaproteobacteria bacterium]|nr:hypothetical protein [Deltaproteobacteria bacterium]